MCQPNSSRIRLWSIHPWAVWRELKRTGVVRARPDLIEPFQIPAYDWLVDQMRKRVGPAPAGVTYPMWAWQRWRGLKQPKPDLRVERHYFSGKLVRIELNIVSERVLASDYDLWHFPLNHAYLAASERDDKRFDRELQAARCELYSRERPPRPDLYAKMQASWERVFDLNWQQSYSSYPRADKRLQATVWEFRLEDVVRITPFVGVLRETGHRT